MKRGLESEPSSPLKRRSSSLFSTSAAQDEDGQQEKQEPNLKTAALSNDIASSNSSLKQVRNALISPTATPPPGITAADDDSSSSEAGFFIEETSSKPLHLQSSETALPTLTEVQTQNAPPGDHRTGVIFEDGALHFDRHNRLHKERPIRVQSIQEALEKNQIISRCKPVETLESAANFLNDDDYLRVHLPGYMQRLDKISRCICGDKLDCEAAQYKSMYFTKHSVQEAKKATISLCSLVAKVAAGDLDNGFAVIRPPGHHAEPGLAGGFCVINNVAVAAAFAREKLGLERVLIVDWDVHHGNGTQSIFLRDPNVMYFSVHRWQGGNFFPFLQDGGPSNVGIGHGVGFNINVGWSRKGMGDNEYYAVWEHVLMPMAKEFQPDLVLISAGFDAADGDLGECHVTPDCFADLTRSLKTLARGRVIATLEGGYVRRILSKCVTYVVETLLEHRYGEGYDGEETIPLDCIDTFAAKNIQSTREAHMPYWNCFQSGDGITNSSEMIQGQEGLVRLNIK